MSAQPGGARLFMAALAALVALVLASTTVTASASTILLVADTGNNRILQYDVVGTTVTFNKVFAGEGAAAGNLEALDHPLGATLHSDGKIYVTEQKDDGLIRRYNQDGSYDGIVASSGYTGRPEAIASGPDGNVYFTVAFGSDSDRVWKVDLSNPDPTGNTSLFVATSGGSGGTAYTLWDPRGIDFGPDGSAFVGSRGNDFVYEFQADGTPLGVFGDASGSGSALNGPTILHWHEGELFVDAAYSHAVKRYDASGNLVGDFVTSGSLNNSIGMGFAPDDNLYLSAWGNNAVYVRTGATSVAQVAPTGSEPGGALSGPGEVELFDSHVQIAVFDATDDAHVNLSNDQNYGDINRLRIGLQGGGDDAGTHEGFLKWDLSSLDPVTTEILDVTLRVQQTDGGVEDGFRVWQVLGGWDEDTITGQNAPGVDGTALGDMVVFGSGTGGGISTFHDADLLDLVQGWVDGSIANFGLKLTQLGGNGDTIASTENGVGRLVPQLILTYRIPEPQTALLLCLGGLALPAVMRRRRRD